MSRIGGCPSLISPLSKGGRCVATFKTRRRSAQNLERHRPKSGNVASRIWKRTVQNLERVRNFWKGAQNLETGDSYFQESVQIWKRLARFVLTFLKFPVIIE